MDAQDSHQDLIEEFSDLAQSLSQYLNFQKSCGIAHIEVDPEVRETLGSWGTPAWNQNRFEIKGPDDARILIVDGKGGFFEGKAGRLLIKILEAMHLRPDQVAICNIADLNQLRSRIVSRPPLVIITLGRAAARFLLGTDQAIEAIQGQFHSFGGCRVMPTQHPSYLLADPKLKRGVWEDMKKVMAGLNHDG